MSNTAIVVGGTRRVGRWVSEALLVHGLDVHAIYRADDEAADRCRRELGDAGYGLAVHRADATDAGALGGAIDGIAAAGDGLGLLVNCAGRAASGPLTETDPAALRGLWESNLLTVHNAVRAAAPHLRASRGRIINFLSVSADTARAFSHVPAYAAAKAMLASYSRSLARELAQSGVAVNCIALGVTDLSAEGVAPHDPAALPAGRAVGQEDVAAAVWFLVGPGAEQVSGTVINISGGWGL
jgi:NAD(P)-dependent dehydrogenase (short-subunit alcohol dehydrogenase family)